MQHVGNSTVPGSPNSPPWHRVGCPLSSRADPGPYGTVSFAGVLYVGMLTLGLLSLSMRIRVPCVQAVRFFRQGPVEYAKNVLARSTTGCETVRLLWFGRVTVISRCAASKAI